MDNDKTVLRPRIYPTADVDRTVLSRTEAIIAAVFKSDEQLVADTVYSKNFRVGRAADNDIVINETVVSRYHLEIKREGNVWLLYNLKSANGVYINDKLIENNTILNFPVSIFLGRSGVCLKIKKENTIEEPQAQSLSAEFAAPASPHQTSPSVPNKRPLTEAEIRARYLADEEAEDAGEHTRFVRRIIREDRVVIRKSYKKTIWILSILFCLAVSLAIYQHLALNNTRKLAIDMFYDIKALEVSLSQADLKLEESAGTMEKTLKSITNEKLKLAQEQVRDEQEKLRLEKLRMIEERKRLASMKAKYEKYINQAHSLQLRFPTAQEYEEELIAKVARDLGESELEVPDDFIKEVKKYIQYWQASGRMQKTMEKIQNNDFLAIAIGALEKNGLPLYFIYLPLQESDYNENAVGPQTRYGTAKGAWQLLAGTAQQFGITPGPLADNPEYDAQDQRFDFNLATEAATKYLKVIYSTEAQASGLLVMASYNYGDNRVRSMIANMPDNPRDRNFWKFKQQYELPKETHDYVFYIFSAAVIGEDPQHFGFKFAPPLFKAEATGK